MFLLNEFFSFLAGDKNHLQYTRGFGELQLVFQAKSRPLGGFLPDMAPLARLERTASRLGGGPSILVRYRGILTD